MEALLMRKGSFFSVLIATLLLLVTYPALAQDSVVVLTGAELSRVVPPGFYFQGLSATTQTRNSAAARIGAKRYVIAGLVDTAGYASEVRAKYQGFLITDSPIKVNGSALPAGAYGFGVSNDGKFGVLDLAAAEVLSVPTTKDAELQRPRPLMMTKSNDGLRLYSGKDYVVITAN